MTEMWAMGSGHVLVNVHPESACEGRGCPIHHPSDHHMKDWPMNWRSDRGLMERICVHGVGHPDPDHMDWYRGKYGPDRARAEGIHGCCGCCACAEDAGDCREEEN